MSHQHKYRPQHLALAITLALGCAEFATARQTTADLPAPPLETAEKLIADLDAFINAADTHTVDIKKAADWNVEQLDGRNELVRVLARGNINKVLDGGGGNDILQLDAARGGSLGESRNIQGLEVRQGAWALNGSDDFAKGALVRPNSTLTINGGIAGRALTQGTLVNNGTIGNGADVLSGGFLNNANRIAGRVDVHESGTFTGKGSVGELNVRGRVAMGPVQGAPNVTGDLNLASTAVLDYGINAEGGSSTMVVGGTAHLGDATLKINATGESLQSGQHTIIEAGRIEGQFARIDNDLVFMTPALQYEGQRVGLTYTRNDVPLDSVTDNENGNAFGHSVVETDPPPEIPIVPTDAETFSQTPSATDEAAADDLTAPVPPADEESIVQTPPIGGEAPEDDSTPAPIDGSNSKPAPVAKSPITHPKPAVAKNAAVTALLGSNRATAIQAIEQLAGGVNANLAKATLSSASPVSASMLSAMRQLDSTNGYSNPLGQRYTPRLAAGSEDSGRVWLQALGHGGKLDREVDSLRHSTQGLLLGVDWRIDEEWRLGLAGGKSRTRLDSHELRGDLDSWHLGAYAVRQQGPMSLRLGATYSNHDGSHARQITFTGFRDRPEGRYAASTQDAFAELGYNLGRANVSIEPFASLGYQRYQRDGYTEKGGAAALKVHDQSQHNMNSVFGLRLAKVETLGNGLQLTPRLGASWKHTYGEVQTTTRQRLVTGGKNFTVHGADLDRDSLLLDVGLDLRASNNHTLGVGLTGEAGSDGRSYGVTGQWRMAF
jgi:outer membrane autotransporter protein